MKSGEYYSNHFMLHLIYCFCFEHDIEIEFKWIYMLDIPFLKLMSVRSQTIDYRVLIGAIVAGVNVGFPEYQ